MGQLEIETVVRDVVKKVLSDPTASKETSKKRAYAIKHLGKAYREVGKRGRRNEKDPFNLEELAKGTDEMGRKETSSQPPSDTPKEVHQDKEREKEQQPTEQTPQPARTWARTGPKVPAGNAVPRFSSHSSTSHDSQV